MAHRQPLAPGTSRHHDKQEQIVSNESVDSGLSQSRDNAHSGTSTWVPRESRTRTDLVELDSVVDDFGVVSLSQLRAEVLKLRSENTALQGLLKEQNSTEHKEKESADVSASSSDGRAEWRPNREMRPEEVQNLVSVKGQRTSRGRPAKKTKAKTEEKKSLHAKQQPAAKLQPTKQTEGKSRLPVPVRLRFLPSSTPSENAQLSHGNDQRDPVDVTSAESDALRQQSRNDCPGVSSVLSDNSSDAVEDQCPINPGSSTQLELLNQECQEKDSLIQELREQLGEREDLRPQLQEMELLNCRYAEELQAQKNTIAYLTACSLHNQNGLGSQPCASVSDASLQSKCEDLHKTLLEKEEVIAQHLVLMDIAKQILSSLDSQECGPELQDLCLKIETVLAQDESLGEHISRGQKEDPVESLQAALLEQERLNAQLQERLRAALGAAQHGGVGECTILLQTQRELGDHSRGEVRTDMDSLRRLNKVLTSCLDLAESAVISLVDTSGPSSELQQQLDQLQTCLKERQELEKLGEPTLHENLCVLWKHLSDCTQKLSQLQVSLQEERMCREEGEARATALEGKGLPPSVQLQLEALHKALREKKKACRNLQERLASAQSNMTDASSHSYSDLEVGVKPGCSTSSLPSLLKQEQVTFSSTENLDSTSSTPYPSSPALSSAKASLRSPHEDSGVSEDSARMMKAHQENKCAGLSPNKSHLSASRNPDGMQREETESQAVTSQTSGAEQEKKSPNRSFSEQMTRSRSTSPARLDSLVQSQARELSQLRQQIKESRQPGCLPRRQLLELRKAFQELLQASEMDCYRWEVVKGQLDKSMVILDRLEGRLDQGDSHLENHDTAALELSRRLAVELQEKNRLIQSLQSQLRAQSPSSRRSSHSDGTSSSCRSSPTMPGRHGTRRRHAEARVLQEGGAEASDVRLQRENGRLQERLRSSEDLNASLRCELDLHRSIMAQNRQQLDESQTGTSEDAGNISSHSNAPPQTICPDLLAEHLQEIRALRQRLEESICTNDRLREQLEKRLAEVEKDSATNIFIHGSEEKLTSELRLLWEQNQSLKEQVQQVSRDKQRENEKLRDTLMRRTSKLEQNRAECDALRQERQRLQERLEISSRENSQLRDSLQCSSQELSRLQVEMKLQQQQLTDSQRLLQSLRVELQVFEEMKAEAQRHREAPECVPAAGPVDLSELLSEIRRLRLQLERSIQTNTALRQKLEEQLLKGTGRSDTININYLRSPDEGGRSPGREGRDLNHSTSHHHHDGDVRDMDSGSSVSSSSGDALSDAPHRLVPGHRMWADRNGRHVLALIEDFNALRKQISEGRKLSRCMQAQLQAVEQQSSNPQEVKGFSSSMSSMQQVLGEASRLLKLVWRVSLPAGSSAGDGSSNNNNQQEQHLVEEISRLKSRLSQQEKMLSGAVKRLRTTNQLKEGMERVIIDQLCLTHGVLKKARGNLEEVPVNGQ